MIYGVDVSNWQPERFPLELSDGKPVDFVIIQVTRGMSGLNEKWRAQASWARQNGLAVGFYHFGTIEAPDAQARRFNAELTKTNIDTLYPGETLWYDWEASGTPATAPSNAQKDHFIKELKKLRPGRKVGLYCNVDFWKNRDTTDYAGDALWIASWAPQGQDPALPPIERPWTIHQYADGPGVDHDRAGFMSREEMKVWGGKPEDPTVTALRDIQATLRLVGEAVRAMGEAQLHEAAVGDSRYQDFQERLIRIEDRVSMIRPPTAQLIVDTLAQRLNGS